MCLMRRFATVKEQRHNKSLDCECKLPKQNVFSVLAGSHESIQSLKNGWCKDGGQVEGR